MTEARSVDGDDAISLRQSSEDPADFEIPRHCAVAVQQHERRSLASLEIMEVDPFNIEEAAGGWVVSLRPPSAPSDEQSRGSNDGRGSSASPRAPRWQPAIVSRSTVAFHNFLQGVARERASEYVQSVANDAADTGQIGYNCSTIPHRW